MQSVLYFFCRSSLVKMNAVKKRKFNTLTLERKKAVLDEIDAHPERLKSEIAREYSIPVSTLSTILKNREKIEECLANAGNGKGRKRHRATEFPEVEKAVYRWFVQKRDLQIPISGPFLQQKAIHFARALKYDSFTASNGWLSGFKKRHGIVFRTVSGESAAVDHETCDSWKDEVLPSLLKDYKPSDIFNADETGLFFKCLPNRSLMLSTETGHGGKHSKERLSLLLGVNMDGTEKLPSLIIGKSKKPRCFAGVKSLPVEYTANRKAWMTNEIFSAWLLKIDRQMTRAGRKILLFVDNCSAHSPTPPLKSVRVEYLPPNTTSVLQPLDLGVIQNFKTLYRMEVIRKILDDIDNNVTTSMNVLFAIRLVHKSWRNVTATTVARCFRKAGFVHSSLDNEDHCTQSEEQIDDAAENLWIQMTTKYPETNDVSMDTFFHVDDKLLVTSPLTDNDILQECVDDDDESEDEDNEPTDLPSRKCTIKEAKAAVQILQSFFEQCDNVDDDVFSTLLNVDNFVDLNRESRMKQSSIKDYFSCG